jgi:hypothetical protein
MQYYRRQLDYILTHGCNEAMVMEVTLFVNIEKSIFTKYVE